ncbi:MAG: phosphoglycolate phosphatase [Thermoplasmata archaeon]
MTPLRPKRPRTKVRAVVTDIDGTLTDADRRLSIEAVQALRSVEAQGIPVLLATGNVLPVALAIHRSIGLNGPIVAENGGLLYRREGRTDSVETLADRSVALQAYRKLRNAGLPVRRLFTDRWRETEVALEPNVSVAAVRRCLRGGPVFVEGTGYALHLMERGAGKVFAVRKALASLGITLEECLVAGDGDNDVGMLRAARFGVSFPTASPGARRAADFVAPSGYARGFVEGLKAGRVYRD